MESATNYPTTPTVESHEASTRRMFRFHQMSDTEVSNFAKAFANASPFPHIVIDDFLSIPASEVAGCFPDDSWPHWNRFVDAYQHQKRSCGDIDLLPAIFQTMVHELSTPAFLGFIEKITGLNALLPDPYLTGGGLHSSGPGGILAPHADFHVYGKMALYRRINVLVYFNPGWRAEFGGRLELFKKGDTEPTASIVPEYGRMVMFLTDDKSIHGFTNPVVGDNRWRNSLALYYYTSEDTEDFKGDGVTYWQTHGKQTAAGQVQLLAYKVLQRGAWTLSRYAHSLNPNLKGKRSVSSRADE
jgi:Rps23 Pro-64 3,4-dihydroxylase Tpa1-like proline 4-hydroxylase